MVMCHHYVLFYGMWDVCHKCVSYISSRCIILLLPLIRYMTDAFHQINTIAKAHKVPLRTAAFLLAAQRVADAEKHRGFD